MRKHFIFLLAIAVFLVPQLTFAKSNIKKAKEYAFIEEYKLAFDSIDKAIKEDPLNANIHYDAAIIYLQFNYLPQFKKEIKNACKLKQSFCSKGSEIFENIAINSIEQGMNTNVCVSYINQAIKFNHTRRNSIMEKLLTHGENYLASGDLPRADAFFTTLYYFDHSHGKTISKLYIESVPNFQAQAILFSLKRAIHFNSSCKKEVGNITAKLAKDNLYTKKQRLSFKNLAKKYLNEKEYFAYFPPPTWQQFGKTQTFVGKGMGDEDYVLALSCGKDFERGDKIIVTGINAEVAMHNKWNKLTEGHYSIVIKYANKGEGIAVRAPKNEKIYLTVQRLE